MPVLSNPRDLPNMSFRRTWSGWPREGYNLVSSDLQAEREGYSMATMRLAELANATKVGGTGSGTSRCAQRGSGALGL